MLCWRLKFKNKKIKNYKGNITISFYTYFKILLISMNKNLIWTCYWIHSIDVCNIYSPYLFYINIKCFTSLIYYSLKKFVKQDIHYCNSQMTQYWNIIICYSIRRIEKFLFWIEIIIRAITVTWYHRRRASSVIQTNIKSH